MSERQPPPIDIEVQAMMDGYPITIRKAGANLDQLEAIISRLMEIGAMPPTPPAASPAMAAPAAGGAVQVPGFTTPPLCPYHGPMKPSAKQNGGWYCPKKMGDDTYCKEKR